MRTHTHLDVHGATRRGRRRSAVGDRFAAADLTKALRLRQTNLDLDQPEPTLRQHQGHVFLVSQDGAGAADGVSTTRSAVEQLLEEVPWSRLAGGQPADVTLALHTALHNVLDRAPGQDDPRPAARTARRSGLSLAFVHGPDLYLAHTGPGAAFLQRGPERVDLRSPAPDRPREGPAPDPRLAEDRPRLWSWTGVPQADPGDDGVQVVHHRLEPGDVLVLLTEGVDQPRARLRASFLEGASSRAEQVVERLLPARPERDATALVVRFLPAVAVGAVAVEDPPHPDLRERRERPDPRRAPRRLGRLVARLRALGRRVPPVPTPPGPTPEPRAPVSPTPPDDPSDPRTVRIPPSDDLPTPKRRRTA